MRMIFWSRGEVLLTALCEAQDIILPQFVDGEVIYNADRYCTKEAIRIYKHRGFLTDKMTTSHTLRGITKL
jgi:hypothetical protein